MNSQVVARRKEASAGGIIRPLLTYALLSFLPPAKESTSSLKEREARARASDPASAAASDLRPGQQGRAKQSGRGRHATSPWQIPWAGWKDILWRTYGQIGDDRLLAVAAGVVFYGLLAIFPAVTAFVSLYGLFARASTISDHLSLAAGVIPSGGVEIIQEQINRITAKGDARLVAKAHGIDFHLLVRIDPVRTRIGHLYAHDRAAARHLRLDHHAWLS